MFSLTFMVELRPLVSITLQVRTLPQDKEWEANTEVEQVPLTPQLTIVR